MDLAAASNFFSYIPLDWIIAAIIVILLAFDSIRSGPRRAIALSIAFPIVFLLTASFSNAKFLASISAQLTSPLLQSALFGAILIAVYLFLRRIYSGYERSRGALSQSIVSATAAAAIALVFWIQMPALQSIWHFGPQIQAVFGEAYKFWWLIGSYIALAFVRR